MTDTNWAALNGRLVEALKLEATPIAIAFSSDPPANVRAFDEPMSEPTPDGRQGRVAASCVFWMRAGEGAFTTRPEDHGNCSVGRVTHGLASLEEVAANEDVEALLGTGWVGSDDVAGLPSVTPRPGAISYAPLAAVPQGMEPDVVMVRVDGRQMMVLTDAIPSLVIGGKPQCHIIALAKRRQPAASVGCALSRARTGMPADEMTCALPASELEGLVASIEQAVATDSVVSGYALEDARRFG